MFHTLVVLQELYILIQDGRECYLLLFAFFRLDRSQNTKIFAGHNVVHYIAAFQKSSFFIGGCGSDSKPYRCHSAVVIVFDFASVVVDSLNWV